MVKKLIKKKNNSKKELSFYYLLLSRIKTKKFLFFNIFILIILLFIFLYIVFGGARRFKIAVRERLFIVFIYIICIQSFIIFIQYIIFIIINEDKKKEGLKIYFVEFLIKTICIILHFSILKIIMFVLSKSKINSLKKDLMILQNYMNEFKVIKSIEDLHNKASELINDKLKINIKYAFDDHFLHTFSEIDVFVYYYLAKYPDDCAYYRNIYLSMPNDILIFESKITNNKQQSIDFVKKIINNSCKDKRFVFFSITLRLIIEGKKEGHRVLFIVDKYRKTVEYFDPNITGILYRRSGRYETKKHTHDEEDVINSILKDYFKDYKEEDKKFTETFIKEHGICYIDNKKIVGLQFHDDPKDKKKKSIEKQGYCVNWSWFYLDERLKKENRDLSQIEVIKKLIKKLNKKVGDELGYISYIRHFALFQKGIELIRDKYIYFEAEEFAKIAIEVFTEDSI